MANMMLREMQLSMMFPGFKFSPTDEELISFYLRKKIEGSDDSVQVISEIDLCQFEPWDLPERSVIPSNSEWFFFCARGKKYPNGLQSKRATECGYWKATGKERNVKSGSNVIGTKRTLVFHKGRAPKGERTEWIMHEYCISGNSQNTRVVCRLRKNSEFRIIGNPRRGSRNRSANNSLGEDDIDLTGLFDEDKALDGCNSSYNSHSVEPTDSGSESDQNITNDPLLHASSSHQSQQKDGEGEDDDCFAEIMNDDIIKLDESSLPTDSHFEGTIIKRQQAAPKVGLDDQIPTQGAANQRIRLLMKNMKTNLSRSNSSEGLEVGNDDVSINTHVETRSCMLVKWQFIDMVLVILGLLALFFFCMGRNN